MWALRRASVHLRNQGVRSGSNIIRCSKSDISRCQNNNTGTIDPQEKIFDGLLPSARFLNTSSVSLKSDIEFRTFSSQSDAKTTEEDDDDLEDGFSELGTTAGTVISEDDSDVECISGEDGIADEDMQNELEVLEVETGAGEKKSRGYRRAYSPMTGAILASLPVPVSEVLDKWVKEGNKVTQSKATTTIRNLRKREIFGKALELSEWMESEKSFDLDESDYASRVDLIAKVRGIDKAEDYIEQIPESLRDESVYSSLLANCVSATNVKKSEELFNKMKKLEFPVTCFSCNQMLILYKRTDNRKIPDVLSFMEKENIEPTDLTYQVLINVKGQSRDIAGMEQVLKKMEDAGLEPNIQTKASLARYYVANGLKDKAESVLKQIEGDDIMKFRLRRACQWLIPVYASLGMEHEVKYIWKVCERDNRVSEYMSVINAWGQLNRIDNAESAFDLMMKNVESPSTKYFNALLKVYADHKMLAKGKELVRRMGESGCKLGPLTWDSIVRLYVGAGEVEKADSVLSKVIMQKQGRPLFLTYHVIMEKYAERGDVHNAEKMLMMMRQSGYASRHRQYRTLLEAYMNAKVPAYGFSERMKADNLFPNKALAGLMEKVDAFKKSPVAELLE